MTYKFVSTGEQRPPKKGEYYSSSNDDTGTVQQAYLDHQDANPYIFKKIEVKWDGYIISNDYCYRVENAQINGDYINADSWQAVSVIGSNKQNRSGAWFINESTYVKDMKCHY